MGGDAVCFVECKTNKVRAKYVKEGEEFFSIAWSYFSDDLNQTDTFVAAGGKGTGGFSSENESNLNGTFKRNLIVR